MVIVAMVLRTLHPIGLGGHNKARRACPPPPRTQTREVTTSPPDRHPVGPPVGPAPQHACRQALDDLRSAEGVAIMAADVVRDHVPHAPQLLGRVRADALLQEDLGLCVRVVRVCTIDAEARRIDGRLCV